MKFCRFVPKSAGVASRVLPSYGLIEGEIIHGISAPPWRQWSREEASLPSREARLLAPVEPSKIVCVGRNYAAHASEMGNPGAERADDFSEDAFVRNRDGRADRAHPLFEPCGLRSRTCGDHREEMFATQRFG